MDVKDLIFECHSQSAADAVDTTIQALPGCIALVVEGSWTGQTARIRVFSGEGMLRFACENQGYAKIIGEQAAS